MSVEEIDNTDPTQVAEAFRKQVAEAAAAQGLAAELGGDLSDYVDRWLTGKLVEQKIAELDLSGTGIDAEDLQQQWSHVESRIGRMLEIARERFGEKEALTTDDENPMGWLPILYRLAGESETANV